MEEIQEINLHIDDQVFPVKKDILCEHSDYFRAMFSGNYIEKERRDINVEVADANSMKIIIRYMDLGSINLSEYALPEIKKLAMVVQFFQITELIKLLESHLDLQLSVSNFMETMEIAEQCSYTKLEHLSAGFGLLSFKSMKPEYIPTIDKLYWYLSHPYLDADNELDVFKFGFDWISHTETGGDALLIILGCLDVKKLSCDDLKQISLLIKDYKKSLAEKVINCLDWLCNSGNISLETVTTKRSVLCETFTVRVYTETYNIVKESKDRKLTYSPVIHRWGQKLMTYTEETRLEEWLEIPEKNLEGWNVTAWGNSKLVAVGGQYIISKNGVRTDSYRKDVMVYDTLRKEWTNHGVELPPRSFAIVAVLNDLLFIVGKNRQGFDTTIVYDLKKRTYKEMTMSIERNEDGKSFSLCSHKGSMYGGTCTQYFYVYEDSGRRQRWRQRWRQLTIHWLENSENIVELTSFKDYIYCSCGRKAIKRLHPGIDKTWQKISLGVYIHGLCSLKTHLLVYLQEAPEGTIRGRQIFYKLSESDTGSDYTDPSTSDFDTESDTSLSSVSDIDAEFLWDCGLQGQVKYIYVTPNDYAESCLLVLGLPPSLRMEAPKYHQRYLSNYSNVYYERNSK